MKLVEFHAAIEILPSLVNPRVSDQIAAIFLAKKRDEILLRTSDPPKSWGELPQERLGHQAMWIDEGQFHAVSLACGISPSASEAILHKHCDGSVMDSANVAPLLEKVFFTPGPLFEFLTDNWVALQFLKKQNFDGIKPFVDQLRSNLKFAKNPVDFKYPLTLLRFAQAQWSAHLANIETSTLFNIKKNATSKQPRLLARFVALDVEAYEHNRNHIQEVGWSSIDVVSNGSGVSASRMTGHLIVEENKHLRNGDEVADNRDNFSWGTSEILPQAQVADRVCRLLRDSENVVLVLHSAISDVKFLASLGLGKTEFLGFDLPVFVNGKKPGAPHSISLLGGAKRPIVIDTQPLFRGWAMRNNHGGTRAKTGLELVCTTLGIKTKDLHNAGNDAHATLNAFIKMCSSSKKPKKRSPKSG